MHPNLQSLYTIANKSERIILGLMSGTSLDGLDLALCRITGSDFETSCELLQFETVPYLEEVRERIQKVFPREELLIRDLTLLHVWLGNFHGQLVNKTIKKWGYTNKQVDLIASHGQTIYHAPISLHGQKEIGNATLQIGDADQLAVKTGIITLSDFRQKHIAGGGEGAPLAAYGDVLLFGKSSQPLVLLNIGGIANFTYLPGKTGPGEILVSDCGPGNTLMDMFVQKHFSPLTFDKDSKLAKQGEVRQDWLDALLGHPFFKAPFPKSTGQEIFNLQWLEDTCGQQKTEKEKLDMLATLNQLSSVSIALAIHALPGFSDVSKVYVSGGGMHNPLLISNLSNELSGLQVHSLESLGMHPDAKEAILFAVLANQTIAKGAFPIKGLPTLSLGKISFPA